MGYDAGASAEIGSSPSPRAAQSERARQPPQQQHPLVFCKRAPLSLRPPRARASFSPAAAAALQLDAEQLPSAPQPVSVSKKSAFCCWAARSSGQCEIRPRAAEQPMYMGERATH
jgi:hypothetical protein